MRSSSILQRRSFLMGFGAGAITLPFVRQLKARAAIKPPKRLFIMHSPEGFVTSTWAPKQSSGPINTLTNSAVLAPLEPVKDYVIALNGVAMHSHMMQKPYLQGHYGIAHMLTGIRNKGERTSPQGPSVDQIVASRIGDKTKFPSLQLGVQCKLPSNLNDKMFTYMSYRGADQPNPNEQSPLNVFNRLFANAMPSDMTRERLEAQLLRQQSILDLVKNDLADLQKTLGFDERPKLEQHLTAIREVEKLFDPKNPATVAANCAPPVLDNKGAIDLNANSNFPIIAKSMIDLTVAAFACDLTRVVTLQYCTGYGEAVPSWLGLGIIHGIVHSNNGATSSQRNKYERWFAEEFAAVVQKMKAFPESGGNMLDNSLAVWLSSQGEGGGHRLDVYQATLAGKAGGAIKTNQYLALGNTNGGSGAEPHNRLLLNMAHAMDLQDVTVIGEPSLCSKGAFPQLKA
jgi:hypothetical protein